MSVIFCNELDASKNMVNVCSQNIASVQVYTEIKLLERRLKNPKSKSLLENIFPRSLTQSPNCDM